MSLAGCENHKEGFKFAGGQLWDATLAVGEGGLQDLGIQQDAGFSPTHDPPPSPGPSPYCTWKSDMDSSFSGSQGKLE